MRPVVGDRNFPVWMASVAQRLRGNDLPIIEFAQSVPNLTESSANLYELMLVEVRGGCSKRYPRDALNKFARQQTQAHKRVLKQTKRQRGHNEPQAPEAA